MLIDAKTYEQIRTIDEFLGWIDLTNSLRSPNDSADYRERRGLWKKYAGEAEPLGRFLRSQPIFDEQALVCLFIDSQKPDAILRGTNESLAIEVTTTEYPGTIHNLRQLNKYGFGPGETNKVSSESELSEQRARGNPRDFGQVMSKQTLITNELSRIQKRIESKLKKKYEPNTILLVDSRSSSLAEMDHSEIRSRFERFRGQKLFKTIYLILFPQRIHAL